VPIDPTTPAGPPADDPAPAHTAVTASGEAAQELVRESLRMRSFSDTGEGIPETAEWFRALLGRVCVDAALVPTTGHPVVLGTTAAAQPDAPTVVVYGLYDVTPTISREWTVDPLAAHIVDATELGLLPHLGAVVVGRGANNHKGPVIAAICAVEAILSTGRQPPVNLVWVIEGEEEIGSPSLPGFIEAHRDLLAGAAGVWLPTFQQNSAGVMSVRRSYKGTVFTHLTCRGGDWGGPRDGRHVWAGNSAWLDAPMMQLVRALGTLFDDQQHATIDGLESLETQTRTALADDVLRMARDFHANPQWQANMLGNLNVAQPLAGKAIGDHVEYYMTGVTVNVQGIVGGYQGPTFYTMMPGEASARLDFRFPPGLTPNEFCAALRAHLDRRGFTHVVLENARGYPGSPPLPLEDDTLLTAAVAAADQQDVPTAIWPLANNCCPGALFTALGRAMPFSVAGLGHGDRAHAPDEYFTVGSVGRLMHFTVDYLEAIRRACAERPAAPPR